MKILGIDPGGTTGWAIIEVIDKKIRPISIGELKGQNKTEDFQDLISSVDVVVVENFLLRPKKAKKGAFDWNPMDTTREIGQIQTLCDLAKKKFVLQEPSVKPVGYGFANQEYVPGKKGQHKKDAVAHAVFYAVRHLNAYPVTAY